MTNKRFKIRRNALGMKFICYDGKYILMGTFADTDGLKEVCDLLNEQEEQIKDLETRNKRQYERLKELTDLMFKRDWKTLETMVDEWEKEDEYLRKYGG